MDNSEFNIVNLGISNGKIIDAADMEVSLENLFYSTLEHLREEWESNNAVDILLTLFFYRRILSLDETDFNACIKIEQEDRRVLSQTFVFNNNEYKILYSDFRYAIINISRQNPIVENIYVPLLTALENEDNIGILFRILTKLNEHDFSLESYDKNTFGSFFNNTLNSSAHRFGIERNYLAAPNILDHLLAELASPKEEEICFDPSAGIGSILVAMNRLNSQSKFIALEKDPYLWALCRMNLIMNGIYHVGLYQEHSLLSNLESETADIAIGHFQFGLTLETRLIKNRPYVSIPFEVTHSKDTDCNNLYIQQMLYMLKPNGRMICLLPVSALVKEAEERKMRDYLLRRDWVEAVITLPSAMLHNTTMPLSVLVINKQKPIPRKQKILFINASTLEIDNKSKMYNSLSDEHLHSIVSVFNNFGDQRDTILDQFVAVVDTERVLSANSNLNSKHYAAPFIRELERLAIEGNLAPLSSVFKKASPALWVDKSDLNFLSLPFVSTEDIAVSFADYRLNETRLKRFGGQEENEGRLLSENAVIVNLDENIVRISYFECQGSPILLSRKLLAFEIDESKILVEYLILQLYTKLFGQQLNMFKTDHEEEILSESLFADLQIPVPSVVIQEKMIRDGKLMLLQKEEQKVETLRERLNLDKQEAQNKQSRIISSLHHELGNRLPAILNEFKNLRDYLKDKAVSAESINLDEAIFPVFDEDINDQGADKLKEVLHRIESMLIQSISSIDAAGNIVNADREKMNLEYCDIVEFLEEFAKLYSSEKGFSINVEAVPDEKGKALHLKTLIDRSQMTTAFSNLIENAKNHGFRDNKKHRVNFRVALSEDKKEIVIEYKNDGKSFPKNFSFQDFISYGQYAGDSGNTGIGGYLIHQIIENHDGSLVYKEKTERQDPFNVQFEIVLPCRKIMKKNNE